MENNAKATKDNFLTLGEFREIIDNIDHSHDEDIVVISAGTSDYRPIYKANHNSVATNELYLHSEEDIWYGDSRIRDEYEEEYKNDPFYGKGDEYKMWFCTTEEAERAIKCIAIYANHPMF